MRATEERRWGTVLLAVGAARGAALAGASLVSAGDEATVPPDAVAVVNGAPVLRVDYERALAAVAADRRGGELTEGDRRRVLDRLVDQELLVDRALELRLPSRDRKVRNDLATAMIGVIRARAEAAPPPGEAELRRWYQRNRGRFGTEPRLVVDHAYFRIGEDGDEGARARAEAALRAGLPAGAGDAFDLPVPEGPLPPATLIQRLGPTATRGVLSLEPGEAGGPWRSSHGYHAVRLLERVEGEPPPFEEVIDRVRREHRRDAEERELTRFLEEARADATVLVAEDP